MSMTEPPLSRWRPDAPLRLAGVRLVGRLRPLARSFRLSELPSGHRAPRSRRALLPSELHATVQARARCVHVCVGAPGWPQAYAPPQALATERKPRFLGTR